MEGPPSQQIVAAPPHRWGLGAFVLVALAYLAVSVGMVGLLGGNGPVPASSLAVAVVVPTAAAAGVAVLVTTLRGNGPRTDLRLHWSWREVRMGLMFGFGGLLITIPTSMVYRAVVGPGANSAVGRIFGGLRADWPWAGAVLLIVAVVGPFCEEIVFRGLLWGAVEQRWGRWAALVVSTLVFALAHLELTRAPLLLVVAIPIALARWYSGGLLASIVAHQVTNFLPGVVLMLSLLGALPAS
ncbi:CPBP family intramembrane glutamic endopeptidase [Mycobacterium sp. 050134]|uniref:CPBP family intramembrane glutamic endopeptidase n=1 Tax=Mycobacterium sp. 050134 TaxID=3096111 RepID=UPI002EDAB0E6